MERPIKNALISNEILLLRLSFIVVGFFFFFTIRRKFHRYTGAVRFHNIYTLVIRVRRYIHTSIMSYKYVDII